MKKTLVGVAPSSKAYKLWNPSEYLPALSKNMLFISTYLLDKKYLYIDEYNFNSQSKYVPDIV